MALAYTIRDRMLHRSLHVIREYFKQRTKIVSYLSAEFLMGPHLGNNLVNLELYDQVDEAMKELGLELDDLLDRFRIVPLPGDIHQESAIRRIRGILHVHMGQPRCPRPV